MSENRVQLKLFGWQIMEPFSGPPILGLSVICRHYRRRRRPACCVRDAILRPGRKFASGTQDCVRDAGLRPGCKFAAGVQACVRDASLRPGRNVRPGRNLSAGT